MIVCDFYLAYDFKIVTIVLFSVVYETRRCGLHSYRADCDRQRAYLCGYLVVGRNFFVAVFDNDRAFDNDIRFTTDVGYTALYGCRDNMSVNYARTVFFIERIGTDSAVNERSAVVHSRLAVGGESDWALRDFESAVNVGDIVVLGQGFIVFCDANDNAVFYFANVTKRCKFNCGNAVSFVGEQTFVFTLLRVRKVVV